ncbi:cyclic nucleotide-binding domain protein (macronuclear) [Tetrahymena thermophila SB210]|uniref:Cyclic nucleotide-binding domain protein n=1 Tax=Tetrahymena thermophila (strain SB210) TaxID=312017 RepID=Q245W2_TETTS|nr:cyclic nucleotide-binding domain protein [Tetrahymena thermophila SB210]EAS03521.2 cyclic nucleotide-binding domain protein [Tetrahymena thermophila SB210]|eukprot:XP_001023766.2 cyclic nucleotide-binding domain protein [Tetrahymena thermophila SB210]
MNQLSFLNDKEYQYAFRKEVESLNGSNINMIQNEFTEVGKGMKYKMEKQVIDNEFCKICFKRDSLVVSDNSLYEKHQFGDQFKQDKSQIRPQDASALSSQNIERMNNQSNTVYINDNLQLREVEASNQIELMNNTFSLLKKPFNDKLDNKQNENIFHHAYNKQDQETTIRPKNISDQISQNSPLLKKQQSKKMHQQISNHTALNESSNRYQNPNTLQCPDSSIIQKINFENIEGQDRHNSEQGQQKKKVPTFQKSNGKIKKNFKSENFVRMKSEMFKLFTFIKPKIKKFLFNRTMLGRTKQLTPQVRQHINDYSDFTTEIDKRNVALSFLLYLLNLLEILCYKLRLNKIPLFDPENIFKIIFNTIIVTYNWFYIILVSLQIFFGAYSQYDSIFTYIAEVAWISEMFVQMNTACYYKNQFTNDRKLFNLIVETLLLGHLIACIWNSVAEFQIAVLDVQNTWKQNNRIDTTHWYNVYIECMYYAFATMMTVGTSPTTIMEKSFTALFMLVCSMQLAFIISTIDQILSEINKSQKEYKGDLNVLNQYMRRKKIDLSLQRRVNLHLKKQYQQQSRDKILIEKKALSKLSMYMQNELIVQSNKKILKEFSFFYNLFTEGTLSKIYTIMEEVVYAPFQIIYGQKSYEDESKSIYFILKGSISLFVESNGYDNQKKLIFLDTLQGKQKAFMSSEFQKGNKKKLITLKQGQCFGIYGFFTGVERFVNAYSNNFSTIIKIDRKKMIEILKENQRDYEKFMEIKDKIYFDQNYKDLNLECFVCKSTEHLFDKCDRTHFHKQNPIIFYRFNYSTAQKRKFQQRKSIKKKNIMLSIPLHSEKIQKLREEYSLQDDEDDDEDYDEEMNQYYTYEEDDDDEDLDLENDPNSIQQDNFSIQQHLQNEDSELYAKHNPVSPTSNIHSNMQCNFHSNMNQSNLDQQDEDNQQEKNKAQSDIDDVLDKEMKNERQISNSSSQDLQSISRSEERNFDQDQLEPKSKKSLHYLNKKDKSEIQDLAEKVKSQESAILVTKVRSSLRNDCSQIDQEDTSQQIGQKKVVKIKNPPQSKRRQSVQRTLQSLDKYAEQQIDELSNVAQIQTITTFAQNPKIPINNEMEPQTTQSRRQSIQQSLQQKIKYEKSQTKTIKRASVRYNNNRVSIVRNATLSNAQNQQILFKKIGSHFSAVAQMPGDEVPFYWKMDNLKDYVAYYPEYNSNFVIKRVQMFQSSQIRKKLRLQKKLAHSLQTANLTRLKSNQFSPRRQGQAILQQNQSSQIHHQQSQQHSQIIQNQQIPSTLQQKTLTRASQFESEI